MNWTIDYTTDVQRSIRNIDPQTCERIRFHLHERIASLDDPRQIGQVLDGSELGNFWRCRIGDYRIICDIRDNKLVVLVIEIGHRREVYR